MHVNRKKALNTVSTPSSNRTKPSSTISRAWRLRKRLTRSNGANGKTRLTFCCQPTVDTIIIQLHLENHVLNRAILRQNHQAMESI